MISIIRFTLLVLVTSSLSFGNDYFPLAVGNYWEYEGAQPGQTYRLDVVGTGLVLGNPVFVITETLNGQDSGKSFFSVSDSGDVLAHGGESSDGIPTTYDPPLPYVDAPLFLGKQWSIVSTIVEVPIVLAWSFEAAEEINLTVPAGTFHSFGISLEPSAPTHSLPGFPGASAEKDGSVSPFIWFSLGTGIIQFGVGSEAFRLTGFNAPTSTEEASWSEVKLLFR